MIKKKSQASLEFLFTIGIILFIFLILLMIAFENRIDVQKTEKLLKKRAECLRLSNLVSEVYSAGNGAEIETRTNYLLTIFNTSSMIIEDIENATFVENRIAFLVSNCGPSLTDEYGNPDEALFHSIDEALNPDWYRQCYTQCNNQIDCSWYGARGINKTIEDLMNNTNKYDTIYMEDPTMDYQYRTAFENWTKQGKVLIASEHLVCHSFYCGSGHNCGGSSDTCNIFGIKIHQETSPKWGHETTVENVPDEEVYNLEIGEKMEPEENSWIENISNPDVSGFEVVARYTNRPWLDSYLEPAITQWNYGSGRVYYFNDFQENMITYPAKDFTSEVLVNLIKKAYYSLAPIPQSDVSCTFSARSPYNQITGNIKIRNDQGVVTIENSTAF